MNILRLSILLFVLTGCAKLEVAVDVLKPDVIIKLAEDSLIEDTISQVKYQNGNNIKVMFDDIRNYHYAAYTKTHGILKKSGGSGVKYDLKMKSSKDMLDGFPTNIDPIYIDFQTKWISSVVHIQNVYTDYERDMLKPDSIYLRKKLIIAIKSHEALRDNLEKFINHDLNKTKSLDIEIKDEAVLKTSEITKALFTSNGLLDSKYTYYVISAKDKDWANFYDHSYGAGYLGNVDIAIKALEPGNYTVKGLSFNPADVASTAAKVTTQSVLLAAQIAGVPVNIQGSPQGNGQALASSSSRISKARSDQATLQIQINSQRDAMMKIAQAILNEKDDLAGSSTSKRTQAIASIKTIYDSQSSRLDIIKSSNDGGSL